MPDPFERVRDVVKKLLTLKEPVDTGTAAQAAWKAGRGRLMLVEGLTEALARRAQAVQAVQAAKRRAKMAVAGRLATTGGGVQRRAQADLVAAEHTRAAADAEEEAGYWDAAVEAYRAAIDATAHMKEAGRQFCDTF